MFLHSGATSGDEVRARGRAAARVSRLMAMSVIAAGAGLAATVPALPAQAAGLCTSAPITVSTTCTVAGAAGTTANYVIETIGGGAGGASYSGGAGGSGAIVTSTLSLTAGAELTIVIGMGGTGSGVAEPTLRNSAGGGGSTAILIGSTLLVEAGGGGSQGYTTLGGSAGGANGAGMNAVAYDNGPCGNPTANGQGANTDAMGNGGAAGAPTSCIRVVNLGTPGNSATASTAPGRGGDGANTTTGVGGGNAGGAGYSAGGNGGSSTDDPDDFAPGGAGGGGYGGGGGGASVYHNEGTGGGGGGSTVNPAYSVADPSYEPASATPGEPGAPGELSTGADGSRGQVTISAGPGPIVATAAAPATATETTATLHSSINASGATTTALSVSYSTDPAMASAVPAAITPTSASGSSDTAITSSLTGLTAATTYYYRIAATTEAASIKGSIESFTTPAPPPAPSTTPVTIHQAGKVKGKTPSKHVKLAGTTQKAKATVVIYRAKTRHGTAVRVLTTKSRSNHWQASAVKLGAGSSAYFCARVGTHFSDTIRVPGKVTRSPAPMGRGDVVRCP